MILLILFYACHQNPNFNVYPFEGGLEELLIKEKEIIKDKDKSDQKYKPIYPGESCQNKK